MIFLSSVKGLFKNVIFELVSLSCLKSGLRNLVQSERAIVKTCKKCSQSDCSTSAGERPARRRSNVLEDSDWLCERKMSQPVMKYVCKQIVCNALVIRLLDAGNDIASNRSDLMCLSPPALRRLARELSCRPDHSPDVYKWLRVWRELTCFYHTVWEILRLHVSKRKVEKVRKLSECASKTVGIVIIGMYVTVKHNKF